MHEKQLILAAAPAAYLEQIDARVKLLCALTWAICVVTVPRGRFFLFAIFATVLVALLAANYRLSGKFLRRLAPALPFVAALAVFLPFFTRGTPAWQWGALVVTREGMQTAARVAIAACLCVSAIALVWASTSEEALLVGLRGVGVPALFVSVFAFMLRYLEVLRPELHRLTDARAARTLSSRRGGQLTSAANLVGTLFLRAHERAEHVADAMAARGYTGRPRTYAHAHIHARDVVTLLVFPVLVITLRLSLGNA